MSTLPVGVLLAAGQSRRFGSNKLLHPVFESAPMLLVSAKRLTGVLPDTVAVINQDLLALTTQLEQLGMRVVLNEQAEQGIGTSIACGVKASQDAPGWLIALADMPCIKSDTIAQLANSLTHDAAMVAPEFEQQRGHPVVFGKAYKDELMVLHEDKGARDIIAGHRGQLVLLPTDDKGVITDIDYPPGMKQGERNAQANDITGHKSD